ncbi:GNAT family N-acetyltransferase [Paenibacillus alkaliterrae]|uniref:GNAT family N-acetyltransferase n=1 Tax=Paenibacillus alkaliterrae TaxID=320909 RepID=UPI001F3607C7|nr:GNAT family N-acetyltransferase [Paenibacillus alkaliterrae]MCF2937167.1 GNAT family N-acetyltransferase [Paenibacillus alkaliterrae]
MIQYKNDLAINATDLSQVFEHSGIKRPFQDLNRLQKMIENADIIITAWDQDRMVGVARAITDFSYCCYLSDLAVDLEYQKLGIGKHLVEHVKEAIGSETSLVLLSAPSAVDYYPRIGFNHNDKCFMIPRER